MAGGDGTAGPGAVPGQRWDVALSFAGAQRDYVGQVAAALKAQGVRCFYDEDEQCLAPVPARRPTLPAGLLPAGSSGIRAARLFHRQHERWRPAAMAEWRRLCR